MILAIHQLVRSRMAEAIARLYGLPASDPVIAEMALEAPPRRALGDVAVPVAFALARRLKKAPRASPRIWRPRSEPSTASRGSRRPPMAI